MTPKCIQKNIYSLKKNMEKIAIVTPSIPMHIKKMPIVAPFYFSENVRHFAGRVRIYCHPVQPHTKRTKNKMAIVFPSTAFKSSSHSQAECRSRFPPMEHMAYKLR